MRLADIPQSDIAIRARPMEIGTENRTRSVARTFIKNRAKITTIKANASMSARLTVLTALSIREAWSYIGSRTTPSGKASATVCNRSLTLSMVTFVFAPSRLSTTPSTTSPNCWGLPSASRMVKEVAPWRISPPKLTSATSAILTTNPSSSFRGTLPISRNPSSPLRTHPTPRMTSCSAP